MRWPHVSRMMLRVIALTVFATAATIAHLSPSSLWFSDILVKVSVALVVVTDGWAGAVLALLITPLGLGREIWSADTFGEWAEDAVIITVMLASRQKLFSLKRSESKLRALLASMEDLILILDRDGTYKEIVPTNPSLLYRPAENLIGRRISDVFPPDQAQFFLARIAQALDEQKTVQVDYPLAIDGHSTWFSAAVSPINPSSVIWVARDITERKLAEEALEARVGERTRELSEQMNGRVAAEQTLRTSEERYRSMFDQANDIMFTLSADGVITSINPAFERVLGWPCSEWIGKPFSGLMPANLRIETEEMFSAAVRDGSLPLTQVVVRSKSGARLVLEATLVEQVLSEERVGFMGIARDVTARERALAELRRSEQQLLEAQRIAHVGMFDWDFVSGSVWCSDEMYRMFGLDPSTDPIDFNRFLELIPLDERPNFDEAYAMVIARGQHKWELRVKPAKSSEKILSCSGQLMRDKKGSFTKVVGTAQDVTEKKIAEQRLRDSEERFRLLARATSDAVWDLDLPTGYVWRGDGYESLFGYAQGELAPTIHSWADLVHPDDQERLHESWNEAVEAGELSWSDEYRFRRADGTYANILDNAYIVRDAQKRPVRMLGAMVDITERKQLEEQLEQAKRVTSLGRVAASIAHEVNNVLMGIQPNAEVLQRRGPAELRHVSDNIIQAVRRGKRVTDEILRFTRPAEPSLQCVQVRKFLDRWTEEIRPSLENSIDLHIEAPADVYTLADPLQLGQVLTNLALNSRDAMQERGGRLTVTADLAKSFGAFRFGVVKSPDRFVHFVVRDEGCGMSADRVTQIFEPLFTTKKGGIGLGLSITYQIVMRHNGHIFVESEVGKGSTFHVFLPTTLPVVHQVEAPSQPSLPIRRLLLVEDEPVVASGIAMLMELDGIKVEMVSTGREAVGAIKRFSPDAVVLDIGLPDIDGVTVFRQIQERWPNLPVLFSSGHGDSAKLETYLARPNVGFILKPYAFEAIREALTEIVAPQPLVAAR